MKTALVTGATSGIGREAAVVLAQKGWRVGVVGRNTERASKAADEVRARSGAGDRVVPFACDFNALADVRKLAADVLARFDVLHVLVNNAGAVSDKRQVTVDGYEQTFAVNHLAPFLLTHLLLDRIIASGTPDDPARIVTTASVGHYKGTLDFEDLHYTKGGYFIMSAYQRSKLANVLFTSELARRLAERGVGDRVVTNCLHPGVVATPIWSKAPWFARPFLELGKRLFMISAEEGGGHIVHLAIGDDTKRVSGLYFDQGKQKTPSKLAQDRDAAKRLWSVSEQLTGITGGAGAAVAGAA